ncbi:MAG: hypothetical protein HC896_16560 [Bacteroidales bacterium]|nr:hypothetical protein [Bacteroidales bacterium]
MVSAHGSLVEEIALTVPPGRADMHPSLTVAYNSHNKNGMLGVGWYLKGLSSITRSNDYVINFDNNDKFKLDGEALFYNATDARYHTKSEKYLRIKAFNLNSEGSYWEVTDKGGIKYTYGATAQSHVNAVGKVQALFWALNKVEDPNGNYYEIQYNETGDGAFYPTKIIYTKHNSTPVTQHYMVVFDYVTRPDHTAKYVPTKVQMTKRLDGINIYAGSTATGTGGSLLRKYKFTYELSPVTNQSRLTQLQEFGSDGSSSLPAFRFEYNTIATDVASDQATVATSPPALPPMPATA